MKLGIRYTLFFASFWKIKVFPSSAEILGSYLTIRLTWIRGHARFVCSFIIVCANCGPWGVVFKFVEILTSPVEVLSLTQRGLSPSTVLPLGASSSHGWLQAQLPKIALLILGEQKECADYPANLELSRLLVHYLNWAYKWIKHFLATDALEVSFPLHNQAEPFSHILEKTNPVVPM